MPQTTEYRQSVRETYLAVARELFALNGGWVSFRYEVATRFEERFGLRTPVPDGSAEFDRSLELLHVPLLELDRIVAEWEEWNRAKDSGLVDRYVVSHLSGTVERFRDLVGRIRSTAAFEPEQAEPEVLRQLVDQAFSPEDVNQLVQEVVAALGEYDEVVAQRQQWFAEAQQCRIWRLAAPSTENAPPVPEGPAVGPHMVGPPNIEPSAATPASADATAAEDPGSRNRSAPPATLTLRFAFGAARLPFSDRGRAEAVIRRLSAFGITVETGHLDEAERSGAPVTVRESLVVSCRTGANDGRRSFEIGLADRRAVTGGVDRPLPEGVGTKYTQYQGEVFVDAADTDLFAALARYAVAKDAGGGDGWGSVTLSAGTGVEEAPVVHVSALYDSQRRDVFEAAVRRHHPGARIEWLRDK